MSTNATVQESVSNASNEGNSPEERTLELLKSVSSGRKSVQRVVEHLEGDRPGDRLKGSDWLNAVNMVRRHADDDVVRYGEGEEAVIAITRGEYGRIDHVEVRSRTGRRREFVDWDIATDDLHKTSWTVLPEDEARRRFNAKAAELRGEQR